ncbi:MAG: phosphomannomutase [Bdellovibrio sp.]|nr:MAG: phosphomannomutase [Bdellovibrio sp.]
MFQPVIFREYDIRGVVSKDFDLDFPRDLGRAFAAELKRRGIDAFSKSAKVTVGHDARHSSPAIRDQLILGMMESGLHVIDLGLVTSPISYFSTFTLAGVVGGVMITGSHNPPDYNGFKVSIGKQTIFGEAIQDLRRILEKGDFISAGQGSKESIDIFPSYIDRYQKEFGQIKDIKVVLDCGNGAAGVIVRRLFEAVGLHPTILFEKPDGTFPNHHPDPTVEKNMKSLAQEVVKQGAVVGIGFDGDADRIGVLDEKGKMVYGDELMVLISRSILQHSPSAKIIGDVKCSDRLFADIQKNGGQPIMWKTGHSLIKEKIKVENAPFGGEMSGHIFFADRNYGYDDALYAGLRVCEILAKSGRTISQLLAGLPQAFNTPEIRIDTTEEKKILIVEKLKQAFPPSNRENYRVNLTDGVRVSFPDGWALARSSNTQPVLVMRFESSTLAGMERIKNSFEKIVQKYL